MRSSPGHRSSGVHNPDSETDDIGPLHILSTGPLTRLTSCLPGRPGAVLPSSACPPDLMVYLPIH